MKLPASLVEHGEGWYWIRGVTDAFHEKENREKLLKPILETLAKKAR